MVVACALAIIDPNHNAIAREHELSIRITTDFDQVIMVQLVVTNAKHSQIARAVLPTVGTVLDVMDVEISR